MKLLNELTMLQDDSKLIPKMYSSTEVRALLKLQDKILMELFKDKYGELLDEKLK